MEVKVTLTFRAALLQSRCIAEERVYLALVNGLLLQHEQAVAISSLNMYSVQHEPVDEQNIQTGIRNRLFMLQQKPVDEGKVDVPRSVNGARVSQTRAGSGASRDIDF